MSGRRSWAAGLSSTGTRRTGCLVEVVVDARIQAAIEEEGVEVGARAPRSLDGRADAPQQLAVVGIVHLHRLQHLTVAVAPRTAFRRVVGASAGRRQPRTIPTSRLPP